MSIQIPQEMQESESKEMIVEGYAIRFNEPAIFTWDGIEYYEIVDPSALDSTDTKDCCFKYNHSDNVMIMARTRSKTLQLVRDEIGLKVIANIADTSSGKDLYTLIKRGDIDKMSFGFTCRKDAYDNKTRTRTILDIDRLFDVSAVDIPAYDTTSISARGRFESLESDLKKLESLELRKKLILQTYL